MPTFWFSKPTTCGVYNTKQYQSERIKREVTSKIIKHPHKETIPSNFA